MKIITKCFRLLSPSGSQVSPKDILDISC